MAFSSALSIALFVLFSLVVLSNGLSISVANSNRRLFLSSSAAAAAAFLATPSPALARFLLNEDTGDYDEVDDPTWQEAWKGRLDKAQSMTNDEVFMAARGAGNISTGTSEASKKRRAMSACRDPNLLSKSGAGSEKDCTGRVLNGDLDFMLKVMDQ